MAGSNFGNLFKISTFGESHGSALGVVIDGCPPLLSLSAEDIQVELDRRRPGQSAVTTDRNEPDQVEILSGVVDGKTLGSPIAMIVRNKDQHSADYQSISKVFRPSHADFTYQQKYGIRAIAGGGRASARETTARIMAGAVAKKILATHYAIEIVAAVASVKDIVASFDVENVKLEDVESNIMRCPDQAAAEKMIELVKEMKAEGNSVGGVISCVIKNAPVGLGNPVFDRLEADLAKACLSIPATKGFEIGSGFAGTKMTGLEHNDRFINKGGTVGTETNRSGGVQGGISNGEPIVFRVAFKPTSTVLKSQKTVDSDGNETTIENLKGRHDPCVLPRAVPIVEAMAALVLIDHALMQKSIS